MKKWNYKTLALICGGMMVVAFAGCALAGSPTIEAGKGQTVESITSTDSTEPAALPETSPEDNAGADVPGEGTPDTPVLADQYGPIWGPVLSVGDSSITIDNQSGISYTDEIILNIDPEASRVLDSVDGYPVQIADIKEGDVIYAYIGPAMTMSIPPMTTATTVICQIPQDFAVPSFLTVKSMEQQADESYVLTGTDGTIIQVPADCNILPYLTRNLVRLTDVEKGSQCLVWSGSDGHAEKIVLFPAE